MGTRAFPTSVAGFGTDFVHARAFEGKGAEAHNGSTTTTATSLEVVVTMVNWDEDFSKSQAVTIEGCNPHQEVAVCVGPF